MLVRVWGAWELPALPVGIEVVQPLGNRFSVSQKVTVGPQPPHF